MLVIVLRARFCRVPREWVKVLDIVAGRDLRRAELRELQSVRGREKLKVERVRRDALVLGACQPSHPALHRTGGMGSKCRK
jgi:hypothetical protein